MYFTIYKITNKINGKIYIGKHQTRNPNDSYYGSGRAITASIKKYGKENFQKEILFIFETEAEMNQKEKELITEEFVLREDTYNLGVGGEGGPHFKGKTFSKESRRKISDSNRKTKKFFSEQARIRLSECAKNRIYSDETKEKMKLSATNRLHSEETINKIKESRKKQVFSEETKQKMSESAKRRRNNFSGTLEQLVSSSSS